MLGDQTRRHSEQVGGRWGPANLVSSLTNITAITWAGYRSYLALRKDGVVLGFRLWRESDGVRPEPGVRLVKIQGRILSNIVAIASMGTPLVLNKEGRVLQLGYQIPGKPSGETHRYWSRG